MTDPGQVLEQIEKLSQNQFLPIIGPQKGKILTQVIDQHHPRRILEVGTLVGYSAILMATHLPASAQIVTIEIDPNTAAIASFHFHQSHISPIITQKIGDALEIIPTLKGKFDLLFLDAAKEQYFDYLQLAEPKLSQKAVIVADNVKIFASTMQDYLDYVRKSGRYHSTIHDLGHDAIEVSQRT